jgi:adenylate kinase family enzyme
MENKAKLIWFLGSNASGKTTQSKLLHEALSDPTSKKLITENFGEVELKATIFDNSCHVGHLKDNQCTGTDTINTKSGIDLSFCYLLSQNPKYIIVDGIMCTSTWLDIFTQFPDSVDIIVILLQFPTVEDNLKRVVERRVCKMIEKGGNDGADIADFDYTVEYEFDNLEQKTIKNVSGKFKGFKSMFEKVKTSCKYSVEIDASLHQDEIHVKILQELDKL